MESRIFIIFVLAFALLLPRYSEAMAENRAPKTPEEIAAFKAVQREAEEATGIKTGDYVPTTETGQATQNIETMNPICNLEATVTSVANDPDDSGYYDVVLKIQKMTVAQASTASACGTAQRDQIEQAGQILRTADYQNTPLHAGDTIRGQIESKSEDEREGYFLSNVTVTEAADPTAKGAGDAKTGNTDPTMKLIGAFSMITVLVLLGMNYASRKRTSDL